MWWFWSNSCRKWITTHFPHLPDFQQACFLTLLLRLNREMQDQTYKRLQWLTITLAYSYCQVPCFKTFNLKLSNVHNGINLFVRLILFWLYALQRFNFYLIVFQHQGDFCEMIETHIWASDHPRMRLALKAAINIGKTSLRVFLNALFLFSLVVRLIDLKIRRWQFRHWGFLVGLINL